MSMGRPKLGYSNLHWTRKITREQKNKTSFQEEILDEPVVVQTLEDKILSNTERIQISKLSDIFCPPSLTKASKQDTLLISPQQGVSNE